MSDAFMIRRALRAGAIRIGQIPAPIDGNPKRVRPQLRLDVPGVT